MRLTYLLKYKQYNAGHVPDLIKPGDSAWGTDWLGESKVPSPLRASAPPPGCQRMGHTHGFGSTEDILSASPSSLASSAL